MKRCAVTLFLMLTGIAGAETPKRIGLVRRPDADAPAPAEQPLPEKKKKKRHAPQPADPSMEGTHAEAPVRGTHAETPPSGVVGTEEAGTKKPTVGKMRSDRQPTGDQPTKPKHPEKPGYGDAPAP